MVDITNFFFIGLLATTLGGFLALLFHSFWKEWRENQSHVLPIPKEVFNRIETLPDSPPEATTKKRKYITADERAFLKDMRRDKEKANP